MKTIQLLYASGAGTLVLFVFNALLQFIPGFGVSAVQTVESNAHTTAQFNQLAGAVTYLVTDHSVSFIASQPAAYYHLARFFTLEFFSAAAVAVLLALGIAQLRSPSLRHNLWLTAVFGLVATFAIHLPYFNWWGFSASYTVGVAFKTIAGWLLAVLVQHRIIYR